MPQINFQQVFIYDAGRRGITVDVKMQFTDASAGFEAKIDTGAEACVFARSLGEEIGLEIEAGELQRFSTVTGSFTAYGHSVNLIVCGIEFDSFVFFAENKNFNRNVLGRHGWLDRVIVGINDYEGKLYLSRYESE